MKAIIYKCAWMYMYEKKKNNQQTNFKGGIPTLSTRASPSRFQKWGRRNKLNLIQTWLNLELELKLKLKSTLRLELKLKLILNLELKLERKLMLTLKLELNPKLSHVNTHNPTCRIVLLYYTPSIHWPIFLRPVEFDFPTFD